MFDGIKTKIKFSPTKYFVAGILAVLAIAVLLCTSLLLSSIVPISQAQNASSQEDYQKKLIDAGTGLPLTVQLEYPTEKDIQSGRFFFKINWSLNWSGKVCLSDSPCEFTITRSDQPAFSEKKPFFEGEKNWSFTHFVTQSDFGGNLGKLQKGEIYYSVKLTDKAGTVMASGDSKTGVFLVQQITVAYKILLETGKAEVTWSGGWCGKSIETGCRYKITRSLRFENPTVIKEIKYTDTPGKGKVIDEGTPTDSASLAKLVYIVELVDASGNVLGRGNSTVPPITGREIAEGAGETAGSWFEKIITAPFRKALAALAAAGMKGLGQMIEWTTSVLEKSNLLYITTPNNFVTAWTAVRDIANLIFVAILVFIAVANIVRFQIEQYSIRSALPYLVLAIFLANFSLVICGFLVDIANKVQDYFLANKPSDFFLITDAGINTTTYNTLEAFISFVGFLMLWGLVFLMFLLCVLFLIVIMFARLAVIYLLAIISPIAFAAFALPGTRKYFQQWWDYFTNFLIMGPLCAFALWLASLILQAKIGIPANLANLNEHATFKTGAGWGDSDIFKLIMAGILIAAAAYVPMILGGKFFAWGAKMITGAAKAYGRFLAGKGVELATRRLTAPAGKLLTAFGAKDLGGLVAQMKGFNPIRDVDAIMAMRAAKEKHAAENAQKKFMTYLGLKMTKHPVLKNFLSDYGEYWSDEVSSTADKIAGSVGLLKASLMYYDEKTGKYHDLMTGKDITNNYKRLLRGFAAAEALNRMPDVHRNANVRMAAAEANAAIAAKDPEALVEALANPALGIEIDTEKAKNLVLYDPYSDKKPEFFDLSGVSTSPDALGWSIKQAKRQAKTAALLSAKISAETGIAANEIERSLRVGTLPKVKLTSQLEKETKEYMNSMKSFQINVERRLRPVLNESFISTLKISDNYRRKPDNFLKETSRQTSSLITRIELNKSNYRSIVNEPATKTFLTENLNLTETEIDSMLDKPEETLRVLKNRVRAIELARYRNSMEAKKDPAIEAEIKKEAYRLWEKRKRPISTPAEQEQDWKDAQNHLLKVMHDNLYRQQHFAAYLPVENPEAAEKLAQEAGITEKDYYERS